MATDEFISKMREIAKDIIMYNPKRKDATFQTHLNKFYSIMRKHGIKQGEWTENGSGTICSNYEWSMCYVLFIDTLNNSRIFHNIFNDVPKDLMAYGRKPKLKLK